MQSISHIVLPLLFVRRRFAEHYTMNLRESRFTATGSESAVCGPTVRDVDDATATDHRVIARFLLAGGPCSKLCGKSGGLEDLNQADAWQTRPPAARARADERLGLEI